MYYKTSVKIPVIKGKIIIKSKGDARYVMYQYGQKYNAEKKYAVPQRTIIGKVVDSDPLSMFPNEKFNEYFPEIAVTEELKDPYRSSVLKIGTFAVIRKIINESGLTELLTKRFGRDTGLLMDVVSHLIVDEESMGRYYGDYAFTHPLFAENMMIYSDQKVQQFLGEIVTEEITDFLKEWNEHCNTREHVYISYESLDSNRRAGDLDFTEDEETSDATGELFALALAFDETNRIPLFYEPYGGKVDDIAQFDYMIDRVNECGYKKVGFILDRGNFSRENIRHIDESGHSFILIMNGYKPFVRNLLFKHRNTFENDPDSFIRNNRMYGKTFREKLYEDDLKERYCHIYFDATRRAKEREQFESMIDQMVYLMDSHLNEIISFNGLYEKFFDLTFDENNVFVGYQEKKDVIRTVLESCGYYCIITSEEMSVTEALSKYFGRDMHEKLFKSDHMITGTKQLRYASREYISIKLFVSFLALIIRNRMYNMLQDDVVTLKNRAHLMSVTSAVRELEKIELVHRHSGQYKMEHAVSTKQKMILNAFGISEEDISSLASEISEYLLHHQSKDETESDHSF